MKKYLLPAMVGGLVASVNVQAQSLTWSVVNRFPLVTDSQFEALSTSWNKWTSDKPKNMHDFIVMRMEAKAKAKQREDYLLVDPTDARGRTKTVLKEPVTVRLTLSGSGNNCTWTPVSARPVVEAGADICQADMVVTPGEATKVEVRDGSGKAHSTNVITKDILIVAMGDSYSSGEGSPDRPAIYHYLDARYTGDDWFMYAHSPTPAEWFDPVCHRSLVSWPVLAALQLALAQKDVTVRLINTTCSGALFYDGLLNAQVKSIGRSNPRAKTADPDDKLHNELTPSRDGEGRRSKDLPNSPLFVRKSQVNEVREALCASTTERDDVSAGNMPFRAKWQHCQDNGRTPDALLLTAGGNDVGFGSAVGGVLIPSKAQYWVTQPVLDLARRMLHLIPPDKLADNVREFSKYYAEYVATTIKGALATPEKTVLMSYPNPIGPGTDACFTKEHSKRLETEYKTFGQLAKAISGSGSGWDVDFTRKEVSLFNNTAFPALQAMIGSANAIKVDWLASARREGSDMAYGYDKRLLCTFDSTHENLEPSYFCNASGNDKCKAEPLRNWNAELPGRKIVNSTNDALLAQRTWKSLPSTNSLARAAAGTFHPTTEAHAVAADSAYAKLCEILKPTHQVCGEQH